MRRELARLATYAIATTIAATGARASEPRFATYFVAVGSAHYAHPPDAGSRGFERIFGANKSARAVAARLSAGGARFGILLTSADGHLVSPTDVQSAVSSVQQRIKSDGAHKPLLVFYFAGHGISEGVGWNLFAVPGTMLYPGNLSDRSVEDVAAASIPAASLVQELDRPRFRYVALLDTCYEGEPASFASPVLTGRAVEGLRSVAGVLRFMNEFHQANPVLFSTRPGTLVSTVADPVEPRSDPVAPLGRRAMLVLDAAASARSQVSLAEFVRRMAAQNTDAVTGPAVTQATPAPDWGAPMLAYPSTPGEIQFRSGTATEGTECCLSKPQAAVATKTATGTVEFSGPAGEYVSGGRGLAYAGTLSASQDDGSSVTVSFQKGDADWELSFSAPSGATLKAGHYARATRYGFAAPGGPSLSITGDGRACNESAGSFDVDAIASDEKGTVRSFRARFEQYCDGSRKPLIGWVGYGPPIQAGGH